MKFGVFLPNGSNGYIPSRAAPQYLPSFAHNRDISVEADRQGFDFVLSMMKFRGFGGSTGYWDACLESFTLMAALAAVTSRVELYPSVALLAHPTIVARMIATIDDISGGRCGLNIVTGWNKPEYTQAGLWPGDDHYHRRYELAAEYLAILRDLWADGRATHDGAFYNLDDCAAYPTPGREIPIVCAGQSPAGVDFTAKHGDHNFVMAQPALLADMVTRIRAEAGRAGRTVGTYALFHVIAADTDAEARGIAERVIAEPDEGAIANFLASAGLDANRGGTSDRLKDGLKLGLEEGNVAFMSFPVLAGSFETVASKIRDIGDATGIDGMLFSWLDFVPGVRDFGEKILPRL